MKDYLYSSLSRLVLHGLMSLTLLSPALMRADTISTFLVSGTATNISPGNLGSCAERATCDFSGTFQVDTTSGTIETSGLDITLPGLTTFDVLNRSVVSLGDWVLQALDNSIPFDILDLFFTTEPTTASLVGFTGGSIVNGTVENGQAFQIYEAFTGSITPVPEPTSLVLLAGVIGSLVFGLTRRFGKKSAIH